MNVAEECLKHLQNRNWIDLNKVLSNNENTKDLAESTVFMIFENFLIDELRRHEDETSEDQIIVASRIFQIHRNENLSFTLSESAFENLTKYLFEKSPQEVYAKILVNDTDAIEFLRKHIKETQSKIDKQRISANLNVKIGEQGELRFDKDIFNSSPQEKELFLAAKEVLPDSILLPNTALSTVINSKVCNYLNKKTVEFFYKSTLDLCIVNAKSYMPELFIELDSGWHDKPKQVENDKMKDEIFLRAGLKLYRLRKIQNKGMIEIFELFIKRNYQQHV